MSLKGSLRRLSRDVEWLENEGTFRHLEILVEMIEMKQQIADNLARDKEKAAEFERAGLLRTLNLPPPSWAQRPASRPEPILRDAALQAAPQDEGVRVASAAPSPMPPEPTKPHPEEPSEARRLEGSEPAPRLQPILRDAPLRGAPQDEVVRVATPPSPPNPRPPPEPELVQPFTYDPPPEMQIRPVTWRRRDARDYDDDPDDMYGKCIVDYDPLAQEDADYYDDED